MLATRTRYVSDAGDLADYLFFLIWSLCFFFLAAAALCDMVGGPQAEAAIYHPRD